MIKSIAIKYTKAGAKYRLERKVNHMVSPLVYFGTSSSLLLDGMNVQISM